MTNIPDPSPNSGRVSQPGGVALPVLSLAGEGQDVAAEELVMDVGVLIEVTASEPEEPEEPVAKKRGRPRKVVEPAEDEAEVDVEVEVEVDGGEES